MSLKLACLGEVGPYVFSLTPDVFLLPSVEEPSVT